MDSLTVLFNYLSVTTAPGNKRMPLSIRRRIRYRAIRSKYCVECEIVGKKLDGEEKELWQQLHEDQCDVMIQ